MPSNSQDPDRPAKIWHMNAIEIDAANLSVKFPITFGSCCPELNVVHRVGSPRTRSNPDSHRQAGNAWRFFSLTNRSDGLLE